MALGQEQGAAGVGVRHSHSFQWQSQPEALMGLLSVNAIISCSKFSESGKARYRCVVTPGKSLPFEIISTKCAAVRCLLLCIQIMLRAQSQKQAHS